MLAKPAAVRVSPRRTKCAPLTHPPTVILGATNPLASAPGTIRGDYAIDVGRNVCHGSDAVESAKKEIALWFKPEEVNKYKSAQFDWVYEKA
jgi:nucleoside-diphosphate kinase